MEKVLYEIGKGEDANPEIIKQGLLEKENVLHLIETLAANRMCGLAYVVLRDHELLSLLNREYRTVLSAVYVYSRERNEVFNAYKKELAELLDSEGIYYAALKGAYLVELYPEGTRTSNDLDILIQREDIPKVTELFKDAGYVQGFIRNEKIVPATRNEIVNALLHRGETIPFVKEVKQVAMPFMEIDVNLSLKGTADSKQVVEKEMLRHRMLMEDDNREGGIYIPDSVDFLIQLCVHLYKEATNDLWIARGMDWTLYKFTDIYLYCKKYLNEKFAVKLVQRIKQYGLEEECFFSLGCMNEMLHYPEQEMILQILERIQIEERGKCS